MSTLTFLGAGSRGGLTAGTKMSAATGDGRVTDYGFAAEAFFSVAAIDPMALLELPFAAVDSLIVVNRRTFKADGFFQDFLHGAMQAAHFGIGQLAA